MENLNVAPAGLFDSWVSITLFITMILGVILCIVMVPFEKISNGVRKMSKKTETIFYSGATCSLLSLALLGAWQIGVIYPQATTVTASNLVTWAENKYVIDLDEATAKKLVTPMFSLDQRQKTELLNGTAYGTAVIVQNSEMSKIRLVRSGDEFKLVETPDSFTSVELKLQGNH